MRHPPDICSFSGRANLEPVSIPSQDGLCFFQLLSPVSPSACLAVRLHDDRTVSFTYKDNKTKKRIPCRLDAMELIGRFLQHMLPNGFVKVRSFGLMGANQGHLLQQLKWLVLKSISKKEQACFLAIEFKVREKQMRCKCCGAPLVLTAILQPMRGP